MTCVMLLAAYLWGDAGALSLLKLKLSFAGSQQKLLLRRCLEPRPLGDAIITRLFSPNCPESILRRAKLPLSGGDEARELELGGDEPPSRAVPM